MFATTNRLNRIIWILPLIVLVTLFSLDLLVKEIVVRHAYELPLLVMSFFGKVDLWIDLVYNKGAAWGTFAEYQKILFVFRCLIVAVVVYLFYKAADLQRKTAFACVLAGAFGNIYDTCVHGKVIDMIHFIFLGQSYGIFNLADLSIFIGVALLMLSKKPCP